MESWGKVRAFRAVEPWVKVKAFRAVFDRLRSAGTLVGEALASDFKIGSTYTTLSEPRCGTVGKSEGVPRRGYSDCRLIAALEQEAQTVGRLVGL